jgi:hypothetical protein
VIRKRAFTLEVIVLLALANWILGAQSQLLAPAPLLSSNKKTNATMSDDEDIAALVIDNGSGMCKGTTEETDGCVRNDEARFRRIAMTAQGIRIRVVSLLSRTVCDSVRDELDYWI